MISRIFGEFVWLGGVNDEVEEQLLVSDVEPLLWRLIDNKCHVAIETRLVLIWGGLGGLSRDWSDLDQVTGIPVILREGFKMQVIL
jgi:hypothetical protein